MFISSNPSISTAGPGEPPSTAEAYPVAAWRDDKIVKFLGRRFDQSVRPRPFVRNFRHLQRDGHYAHKPTRFWLSIQRRAEELLGDGADPSRNYVMTEVVHCKSKGETGVAAAAQTCARRYPDSVLALTTAPIVVVVGKQAHRRLYERLPHLPEPPYIRTAELGGRPRELVFIHHPAGFQGPKTIGGLHGAESVARLRELAALS